MAPVVLDTDVASLIIKNRLPAALAARLIGAQTGITFVTSFECAGGEVFGEFEPHCRVADDGRTGQESFDFAAHVGRVPGRAGRAEPCQDLLDRGVAVKLPGKFKRKLHRSIAVAVAERGQFLQPAAVHVRAGFGRHLVGSLLGPRAGVPGTPLRWSRLRARMRGAPLGFVALDVRADLRCAAGKTHRRTGRAARSHPRR